MKPFDHFGPSLTGHNVLLLLLWRLTVSCFSLFFWSSKVMLMTSASEIDFDDCGMRLFPLKNLRFLAQSNFVFLSSCD